MTVFRRGSFGPEVKRIQTRLRDLGFYRGPLDGDFGGGTESAVKAFQKKEGLGNDGEVGAKTWARLFPEPGAPAPPPPTPPIAAKPLAYRCLALTGTFETGTPPPECFAGLSGNFDGQGISFGVLQWCIGQGSLQPLLREMDAKHPDRLQEIFHDHYPALRAMLQGERKEQLAWARSIQDPRKFVLFEPWRGLFKTLGRTEEFQAIEVAAADALYQKALALCKTYHVASERAVALMFDIKTQNGSISPSVKALIEQGFSRLGGGGGDAEMREVARLRIIANRRAEAAAARWVEDVRKRKLCIANGKGVVHRNALNLETQFGITLARAL